MAPEGLVSPPLGRVPVWFCVCVCVGTLEHWQRVGDDLVCEEGPGCAQHWPRAHRLHVPPAQGLAEYCTLIDSSSSFRAYRAALSEVESPCIPYL